MLEQHETSSSSDDLTAVRNHTDQMLCLLAEERPTESPDGGASMPSMGPILELVVTDNILECLVQWHLCRGLDPDSQGALLKLFEMLIGQSQQPLLQHTAVLHPLLRLLGACADPELGCPSALENSLVLLLNQVPKYTQTSSALHYIHMQLSSVNDYAKSLTAVFTEC